MVANKLQRELKRGSAELLILALLEERQRHGYEIGQLIASRSKDMINFHMTSLYPTLYRLEDRGLIEGRWVERAGQRRRRYYKLTSTGRQTLASQRSVWDTFFVALNRVAKISRSMRGHGSSRTTPRAAHTVDDDIVEELAQHAAAIYESARAEGCETDEAERRVSDQIQAWVATPPLAAGRNVSRWSCHRRATQRFTAILGDVRYAWRLLSGSRRMRPCSWQPWHSAFPPRPFSAASPTVYC